MRGSEAAQFLEIRCADLGGGTERFDAILQRRERLSRTQRASEGRFQSGDFLGICHTDSTLSQLQNCQSRLRSGQFAWCESAAVPAEHAPIVCVAGIGMNPPDGARVAKLVATLQCRHPRLTFWR